MSTAARYQRDMFHPSLRLCAVALLLVVARLGAAESEPAKTAEDFSRTAAKLREEMLGKIEPSVAVPTTARSHGGAYNWRNDIVTTIIAIGASRDTRRSAWDENWVKNFGGVDTPSQAARTKDFRPAGFIPRQNPFYCALPYNDVTRNATKPEARTVIPWFKTAYVSPGTSVCKDRWLAIRNRRNGRIAYAQWSDCGPYRTDHWEYVFGTERPKPNPSGGAGLSVSPSVRDFLGIATTDVTDWRFVDVREVPAGPWRNFGENNPFTQAQPAPAIAR